jgi:nucleoside-diphosphate-sugar epimerase
MRALVTGATGFVGSHLVARLVARADDRHGGPRAHASRPAAIPVEINR